MPREFRFPVSISWDGGRRTHAHVDGKTDVELATPPEFHGTDPGLWSPEDAFVSAAGSCLAVTIAALADNEQLPLHTLDVHAEGIVSRRPDGRLGFTAIHQTVELETDAGREADAGRLVQRAEDGCLVAVSLDLPVHTAIEIRSRAEAQASAAHA